MRYIGFNPKLISLGFVIANLLSTVLTKYLNLAIFTHWHFYWNWENIQIYFGYCYWRLRLVPIVFLQNLLAIKILDNKRLQLNPVFVFQLGTRDRSKIIQHSRWGQVVKLFITWSHFGVYLPHFTTIWKKVQRVWVRQWSLSLLFRQSQSLLATLYFVDKQ